MMHKIILLSALLLPVASYGKSTQARIKELKEVRFQKELELSEIGEKIADKDYLVTSIKKDYSNLLLELMKSKKQECFEKKGSKEPSNEEAETIRKSVTDPIELFLNNLLSAIKEQKKINKVLVKELFDESGTFITIRFLLMRIMIETNLLESLVGKCEECGQMLIDIDQELATLEK